MCQMALRKHCCSLYMATDGSLLSQIASHDSARAGSAGISPKGPWCLVQGNFNSTARIGEVMMRKPHCATCGEVLFTGSVDSLFRMFSRNAVKTDDIFRVYTFSLQEGVSEPVFWRINVLLISVLPVEWKTREQLVLWIFEIPMNKINSVKFCK